MTLSASAFLLGYWLVAEPGSLSNSGSLIQRFTRKESEKPANLPVSASITGRKIAAFTGSLARSNIIIAVDRETGEIFEINSETLAEKLIGLVPEKNFSDISLSPRGNGAIFSYYRPDGGRQSMYLNIANDKTFDIPGIIISHEFSPAIDKFAYLRKLEGINELVISSSKNDARRLFSTRIATAKIGWAGETVSMTTFDLGGYGSLFLIDDAGELTKVLGNHYQLDSVWSPSEEKVLFSEKVEAENKLYYKNLKTGEVKDLNMAVGASQCVWGHDESYVICAVSNRSTAKDEYYRVELASGENAKVATPEALIHTKEMFLDHSGQYLFVLNNLDEIIYKIRLAN